MWMYDFYSLTLQPLERSPIRGRSQIGTCSASNLFAHDIKCREASAVDSSTFCKFSSCVESLERTQCKLIARRRSARIWLFRRFTGTTRVVDLETFKIGLLLHLYVLTPAMRQKCDSTIGSVFQVISTTERDWGTAWERAARVTVEPGANAVRKRFINLTHLLLMKELYCTAIPIFRVGWSFGCCEKEHTGPV